MKCPQAHTDQRALAAFIEQVARIEDLAQRLHAAADDHLGCDPEAINWGHAGTATHIAGLLQSAVTTLNNLHGTGDEI
jgi:hypothetical protein